MTQGKYVPRMWFPTVLAGLVGMPQIYCDWKRRHDTSAAANFAMAIVCHGLARARPAFAEGLLAAHPFLAVAAFIKFLDAQAPPWGALPPPPAGAAPPSALAAAAAVRAAAAAGGGWKRLRAARVARGGGGAGVARGAKRARKVGGGEGAVGASPAARARAARGAARAPHHRARQRRARTSSWPTRRPG